MTIEKLTDDEVGQIEDLQLEATRLDGAVLQKVLRIINAQAKRIAELEHAPHCSACEDYPDLGLLQCTVCGRTGDG